MEAMGRWRGETDVLVEEGLFMGFEKGVLLFFFHREKKVNSKNLQ